MRDKEEPDVVAVTEETEASANNRVFVRRIRQADSGLEGLVVVFNGITESRLIVPAHSIVQREFGSHAPLVLHEKSHIAVIPVRKVVVSLVVQVGLIPSQRQGERRCRGSRTINHGVVCRSEGRWPKHDRHAIRRVSRVGSRSRREWRETGPKCQRTRSLTRIRRYITGIPCGEPRSNGLHIVGKIHQAIDTRENDAHGRETRPDDVIVDAVIVHAKFSQVRALHPVERVGKLAAALISGIEDAEVMAHHDFVHEVQVRLSGRTRESRVSPRVLPKRRVHQAGL